MFEPFARPTETQDSPLAEIIAFPGQPINPKDAPKRDDGSPVTRCEGLMHVFAMVPGRCQCGARLWADLEDHDHDNKEYGIHDPKGES